MKNYERVLFNRNCSIYELKSVNNEFHPPCTSLMNLQKKEKSEIISSHTSPFTLLVEPLAIPIPRHKVHIADYYDM